MLNEQVADVPLGFFLQVVEHPFLQIGRKRRIMSGSRQTLVGERLQKRRLIEFNGKIMLHPQFIGKSPDYAVGESINGSYAQQAVMVQQMGIGCGRPVLQFFCTDVQGCGQAFSE